jgi:hypothetical protein
MSDQRPKRETMSIKEATVSNMWEMNSKEMSDEKMSVLC